jgi:CheY-like chemotaxis protein
MTEPLALVLYEKLLPGSQLLNRLRDLGYRVESLSDAALLVERAEQDRPMVVVADLESTHANISEALGRLKKNPATSHLPILAFHDKPSPEQQKQAAAAGINLLVSDAAILAYLPQLLDQALEIE